MGVGFRVGPRYWEVGTGDFLHAFFSTVSFHLEPGGWGTRFPVLVGRLYQGSLPAELSRTAQSELTLVRQELQGYRPTQVIWDIEDLKKAPPWGDDISPDITDLSSYFVTSDGKDFIAVLDAALRTLEHQGGQLIIGT